MVLLGRIDPNSSLLRVFVPESVIPLGLLKFSFASFSYCEQQNHNHFVSPANERINLTFGRDYQPLIEVNRMVFAVNYRDRTRLTLDLPRPSHAPRRQSERVEAPTVRVLDNVPLNWNVNDDDDDDDDDPQQQQQGNYVADDDEERERVRRAPKLDPIGDNELRVRFGFDPAVTEMRFEALSKDANLNDFDVKTMRTRDIVANLSAFVTFWGSSMGVYGPQNSLGFPYVRAIPLTEAEKKAMIDRMNLPPQVEAPNLSNHCFIELGLPPGFGIGLPMSGCWRMLGFHPDKIRVIPQVGDANRTWVVGNANAGSKYIAGESTNASGIGSIVRSSIPLEMTEFGEDLMRSWQKRQGKKEAELPADALLALHFAPRLVIVPPEYFYVVNLSRYTFPADKDGTLAMLNGLLDVTMGKAKEALGCKLGFRIERKLETGLDNKKRVVFIADYNVADKGACFFVEYNFGSTDLSKHFGLTSLDLFIDFRQFRGRQQFNNKATLPASMVTDKLVQTADAEIWMTKNEINALSMQMRNVKRRSIAPRFETSAFLERELEAFQRWQNDNPEQQPVNVDPAAAPAADDQGAAGGQAAAPAADDQGAAGGQAAAPAADDQGAAGGQADDDDDDQPAPAADDDQPAQAADDDDDDQNPLPPIRVQVPNPLPRPRESYIPLGSVTSGACAGEPNRNVPTDFPNSFIVISENGERRDFFQELGHVCLAGRFTNNGIEPDKTKSFLINNGSTGSHYLDFYIYNAKNMALYENRSPNVGLARCMLTLSN